jgi:hypothetical protein
MAQVGLMSCSSLKDVERDPDFQSRFIQYYGDNDERIWLAAVNDNMTREDRERMILPSEWEVYQIKLKESTRIIDENGNEITKEEFQAHDYEYKVWTKEKFKTKWSKVLTEKETKDLILDHYPIYTAKQIQIVQMTDEEYIARDYSQKEGQYSLQIFFGEAFDNQEMNAKLQQEVWKHIDMTNSKINSISFQKLATDRKEKLLGIEKYPIFILYDHEKLLLKTNNLDELVNFLNLGSVK